MKVSSSETSLQVAAASLVTISGYWYYYDEANNTIPIRYARVKLFDDDSGLATLLAETYTDENGYYQFPPVENDDGIGQGGLDIYVEVYAEGNIDGKDVDSVGVSSNPLIPTPPIISTYWSSTDIVPDIGGDVYMGSWAVIDEDKKGAWYIHDRIIDSYKYMKNTLAFEQSKVNINWWWTGSDKSFAQSTPDYYYFISIASDDEWDRDVITHEYSHTIQAKVYGLFDSLWPNPNCSTHTFNVPSSLTCAYDEGWATFLGVTINNYYDPGDTRYDDDSFYWNIESWLQRGHPTYPALENDADKTEGEVIGIFWDIFDPDNEGNWDRINNNMSNIWDVFSNAKPDDINEFWDDWMSRGHNQDQELWAIYYNHGINKDTTPPSPPTLLSPINNQRVRWDSDTPYLTFDWEDVQDDLSGIRWYRVLVDDDISFVSPEIDFITSISEFTAYYYDYLLDEGLYYWKVQTIDNAGNIGEFSLQESFVIDNSCDDTQAPPAPSSITAPSTSDTGSYTVSWSGVIDLGCSGLSHYELQESTSPDFTVFTTYTTSSTSYLLTERQDGTYYYRVRGIDLAGNSGLWSGIASVTVQRTSSTQIPPIITLPWMRVDDFSDEPVKRITDGGQAIGDWVYSELDDGTDNYVEKLSTFGGRDSVIRFYWGDTYPNNRNIQKIEKVSVYGWDFSYPPGGSLKVLVNDQSSGANYVNVRLTDASGRVSEAGALTTVNSGWQLFKFKRSDFYPVNLQGLSVTQLNRKELLALSNPDNDSVALFISDTGFDWSDIRRVHVIIEQAGSDVETRDIYIDDIAWELPADLRADTYVTSPGKNVTLTIHAINIYNDTLFLDFYIDGRLIDTVENPGTGNVYSRRLVVSHAIPGNYTHTGRVVYVRDGVGDEVFNTNPSTIAVIDTGPPEVQILNPKQDVIYNTSTIHATWSGSDAESGIDHYEVRIDSSPWQNLGNATTYTLSNLTDGVHSLTVKAVDFGGNTATTTSVFWVNTLPPALTLQSPQNRTYPSGSIPLSYSVADAVGIAWVGYSLDSGQNITLRGNTTLSGVSSGPHTLTLYARDRGGYLSHVTVQFSVPYPYIAQSYTTKAEPAVGDTLNISVVLRNPSGAPYSGRVEGSVWLPDGTGEYLGIKRVQIPADGEYTLAFPYSVTNPGTHDYDIYLEPEDGNWQSSISKIYTTAAFRGVGGVEVLSDGFSAGAPSWQTPEWQVSEGAYLGTTLSSSISYYPTIPLDNLTYEVQIKPNLPWGTAGMVFRYRNEKNFYLFTVYPGEGMSRLWSVVNGTWYLLNQTGYPFTNKWYTLRIEVKGSSVRCYINGTQIMEFSGLSSHPSGMVGLRVRDSSAFFDNIKLSDGEGAPIFYEPFTSGAPYWQTLQWTVNNGVYTGNATDNPAISYSSTYNGDNMSYEVTLRITNIKHGANPTAGIVFRYTNEKNYYLLTLYPESSAIKLWNVINGNWYLLSERPYPVSDNTDFRIRLEVAGSRVRAFISDRVTYTEPVLDYKNLNSHTKGRVGLRVRDAVAEFDNVTVVKW